MSLKTLPGLKAEQYEHELDRAALKALKATPGLDIVAKKLIEYGIEKMARVQYAGSNIKVTQNNIPELHKLLVEACTVLDMPQVPDLYLQWGYDINGFTTGVENPFIVLNSGAIDLMSDVELLFVIGHELGHIKSGHVLYHIMANIFPLLGGYLGEMTLGIGRILSQGVQIALANWYRKSELTADRAGLLVCQDKNAIIGSFMKIAGVPRRYYGKITLDTFIQQAKEFKEMDDKVSDKIAKLLSVMSMEHPWTVMRASEILVWIESGEYHKLFSALSKP